MIDPLIIVRDVHLATTLLVAGIVFFDLLIASPVLRSDPRLAKARSAFLGNTNRLLWLGLALSLLSALAWLCLLSARIGGKSVADVIVDGTTWTVLTQTQFGFSWEIRLLLAGFLAVCLLLRHKVHQEPATTWLMAAASLLAGAYLGALAFAGHGTEGLGFARSIHLASDVLHLNAAALWLGALIPLVLLLVRLRQFGSDSWLIASAAAAGRFSILGILAVNGLMVSGAINATFLLGGMHSLIDSAYGRLLLLKIVLFAAMVCLATVNRQRLLPQLSMAAPTDQASRAAERLVRSALVEIALGLAIVLVVGQLGVMPPANELATHLH